MGMTALLGRLAARRVHVLLVEVRGRWLLRAEVERALLARGWCVAVSSADADVVAVCGVPGPEMAETVTEVWEQMPGPRIRVDIASVEVIDSALDRAVAELINPHRHRDDERKSLQPAEQAHGHGAADHSDHGDMDHGDHEGMSDGETGHGSHAGMDHSDHEGIGDGEMGHGSHAGMDHSDHEGMDHGDHEVMSDGEMGHGSHAGMDHSGHEGMDHGGMDMAPAGIALAEGGEDRDGLEMDVLHVRLGPVLAHWPAGLVLRCSLQGDVLTGAETSIIDADRDDGERAGAQSGAAYVVARQCDHIVDLLALAGWPRAAATARHARDLLLHEPQVGRAQAVLEELHRTLRRSRLLRWSLRSLSPLTADRLQHLRLPATLAGDAYDRLLTRVDHARDLLSNQLSPNDIVLDSTGVIDALPYLVVGLDVATTRLVIASLGIDTAATGEPSRHG
ncbi:hypothetical protein VIMS_03313 [Mycobacterium marinum]|uniref:hypothetical protein n=1 Tax=Mycobacterium marinum TaxID=1781 RepID=UPI000ECF1A31|nr:hypothetical protein [Mycobacterium marinum]RFZ11055.1 hypothetical protein VIMS_03313 [Mycobacterium marinum]